MRELRNTQNQLKNTDNASRMVEGYAIVFDSESVDLGGFYEIIERGAIDGVIEKSDVLCLLNHNADRGVLARSKFGVGSLKLEVDEHGLKYSFEAPQTALGDELLEGLRRGDISTSSFGFTVEDDEWVKRADGTILRRIKKIKQLYDVSPVYNPAYQSTEVEIVDKRGLNALLNEENNNSNIDISDMKINKRAKRSNEEILEEIKSLMAEMEQSEEREEEVVEDTENETSEEETQEEVIEEKDADNVSEEETETEENKEVVEEEKEEETTEETEEINNEKRNKNTSMKFSLIQTINDVINNRSLNDAAKAVIKEGRSAMVKAGLKSDDKILIPFETRAEGDAPTATNGIIMATGATVGKENVATDKYDILEPLRANLIMAQSGATILSNLVGNVSIPRYSKSNCAWKGEAVKADDGKGSFDEITLSPKRLTSYIKVSNQFLLQDSNSADEMLKRDLIAALSEKLEATVFGTDAATNEKPAGLFNGITPDTAAIKFGDIVDTEATLENANVNDFIYVVNPSAKAILRKTAKDAGSGKFVMEDGEIEGRKVYVSSNVASKGMLAADMKDLVIGLWGSISLQVDPYTFADEDCVRIVANMYVDVKPRRSESFVAKILK